MPPVMYKYNMYKKLMQLPKSGIRLIERVRDEIVGPKSSSRTNEEHERDRIEWVLQESIDAFERKTGIKTRLISFVSGKQIVGYDVIPADPLASTSGLEPLTDDVHRYSEQYLPLPYHDRQQADQPN